MYLSLSLSLSLEASGGGVYARLISAFAEGTALGSLSMLILMVLPTLVLQRTSDSISHRQRSAHIERRLNLWLAGRFMELLSEGRSLQGQLALLGKKKRSKAVTRQEEDEMDHLSQTFSRCMCQGRVKYALRLLSEPERGQVLPLDEVLLVAQQCEMY